MSTITKNDLANELNVTPQTLRNWLKRLFTKKDCPFNWNDIKNQKILNPKVYNYIKNEL